MDPSAIARDLANLEKSWSSLDWWLNFWTIFVVIGVVVELAVLIAEFSDGWHDFKRATIHSPEKPSFAIYGLGFLGAALVAIGVTGEFRVHSRAGKVETDIRSDYLKLIEIADDRAKTAITHGEELEKEEDTLRKRTEREIDARLALEKDLLFRGPRDVLIRSTGDLIPNAVRRFRGQRFKTSICWPELGSSERMPFPPVNNELMLTENAVRIALSRAGWLVIPSPKQSLQWVDGLPIVFPNCSGPGVFPAFGANAPSETRRAAEALQLVLNKALRQTWPFGGVPTLVMDGPRKGFPPEGIEIHIGIHPVLPGNPMLIVPPEH